MIIPAILEEKFEDVDKKIKLIENTASTAQIDIVDSTVIKGKTFLNLDNLKGYDTKLDLSVHLMVKNPLKYFRKSRFIFPSLKEKIGPLSTVITQLILDKSLSKTLEDFGRLLDNASNNRSTSPDKLQQITDDASNNSSLLVEDNNKIINRFIDDLKSLGYKVGLSLDPFHSTSLLEPFLDKVDLVQFMGVTPGKQGNPLVPVVLNKIKLFKKQFPYITTQIDGGVNDATLLQILETGVDNIVVGSAIFNSENPKKKFLEFSSIVNERKTAYGSKK